MEIKPKLFLSKVMHKRLTPRVNQFTYKLYYLYLPLSQLDNLKTLKRNKFGLISFYDKDHGYRNGSSIKVWARDMLDKYDVKNADGEIVLVTLPRILGYVFNPVSFYFCLDKKQNIKAVICEVNNTFGETHSYICKPPEGQNINPQEWLKTDKIFHVSPFIEREGKYNFRFDLSGEKLGIWIDLYDKEGRKKLLTSLCGKFVDMSKKNIRSAFWNYPLITFKTIFLIHWQAIKLVFKRVKYVPKPEQKKNKTSSTN